MHESTRGRLLKRAALVLLLPALLGGAVADAAPLATGAPVVAGDPGVYLRLATTPAGSFEATHTRLREAIAEAGWTLLADYPAGVNRQKCAFPARVLIAHWPAYARSVVRDQPQGAFAAPVRLAVYEDEQGVHVAAVNPRSLNRTIVAEQGRDAEWAQYAAGLERMVRTRFADAAAADYGQRRAHGRIGKTMGVMAGGAFATQVKTIATLPLGEGGVLGAARQLQEKLKQQAGSGSWKLRPVFLQDLSEQGVVVLGVTGEPMEAKSFDIVGAGGDRTRARLACPGVDHAAAYPLELVLVRRGEVVQVQMVDAMFRMKMYFEDAGMVAFAKNMGMPGSIAAELQARLKGAPAAAR